MEGTFSRGIISRGLNLEIDNAGHITTAGELALEITVGLSNTFRTSEDGQIVNSGVIETVGDGAAGVVMAGDGRRLTNSGLITTDGGAPAKVTALGLLLTRSGH